AGNGADHRFVDVDMLDLDIGNLDPPGVGLCVEDLLDVVVELVAFGQHRIEIVLAEYRAQRCLGELARGRHVVLDLDGGPRRIDDAEVDHRIDPYGDVVAADHVLGRYIEDQDAQVHSHHLLDERNQNDQARSLDAGESAEGEHH